MTQPDSDSRQALIERLNKLRELMWKAHSEDVPEFTWAAESLRQADEEIERVKKERRETAGVDTTLETPDEIVRLLGIIDGFRASLSSATLRNEKLREALEPLAKASEAFADIPDDRWVCVEATHPMESVARRVWIKVSDFRRARAALQLSSDPAEKTP